MDKKWDTQEFQVIILAGGPASDLSPLTDDIPKCILPVANRPLISYPLELVENSSFRGEMVASSECVFLLLLLLSTYSRYRCYGGHQ
jgi:translation initiation factor eIF-2B subunit gamma